jgi:hypothetical protein
MEEKVIDPNKEMPSTTLMTPSKAPKEMYEACALTATERRIVQVTFDSPQLAQAVEEKEIRKELIDRIGYWRKCMSTSANAFLDGKQITFEIDFLCKFFKDITLKELDWMVELYIQRLLPMEYPVYVSFNPDYLARVIHAFRLYKAEKSRRLEDAVVRKTAERKSTLLEKMENTK